MMKSTVKPVQVSERPPGGQAVEMTLSEKSHSCEGIGGSVHLSPDVMLPQARYWMELAIHFSRVLPNPRIEPASLISSELAGGFFTAKATWEALTFAYFQLIPLCMY